MYLLSCLLIVIVSGNAVPKDSKDLPDLKWPLTYTLEVEKISLTSGCIENIKYWRTIHVTRIDYNKGAVKVFSRIKDPTMFEKYKYEVHVETNEEKENYFVCKKKRIYSSNVLDDILPAESNFKHVGYEKIEQKKVEKFFHAKINEYLDVRNTLWATYDQKLESWTPIRYEQIVYDMWLDHKKAHDIWNFDNYELEFDTVGVFDVEKMYDCQNEWVVTEHKEINDLESDNIAPKNGYDVDHVFSSFKETHNKIYANEDEHSLRRALFEKSMRLVIDNNSKNTGYKLAINKFADRTPEEMKKYKGLIRPSQREPDTHSFPYTANEIKKLASDLPKEFDLRDLGLVTPAKDQKECKSSWTFGTTSAVEGALARQNGGRLIRLSNQALLDCSWGFGSTGCNGGHDSGAYRWIMKHGLPTEQDYGPYKGQSDYCHIQNVTNLYSIRGYTNVTPYSVEALKVALINHGPLSVSIYASPSLYLYNGGIFYDDKCEERKLDHEVTLVGYGIRDGEEYWIVKNSWGQNWGVDGYFHISVRDNNCGITTEPTYPVL